MPEKLKQAREKFLKECQVAQELREVGAVQSAQKICENAERIFDLDLFLFVSELHIAEFKKEMAA
ncbi:hypothetical protein P4E94_19670 [Pontiellaceae bacterium B12219]|nr:hypothetical protein [Pontiellaceae bacterium B12219]